MATRTLTARQQRVYDFISNKIRSQGFGPTIREITDEFGWKSPTAALAHLQALEKKGYIKREPNISRSIQLSNNPAIKLLELNEQIIKDWRKGHIRVNESTSKAKAERISETIAAIRRHIPAV